MDDVKLAVGHWWTLRITMTNWNPTFCKVIRECDRRTEVTESEQIKDHIKLRKIFESYSKRGFITAIDDLGSDFAGLAWLEEIRPAVVKLDMSLIRNIEDNPSKRKALAKILVVCKELKSQVLAEGIETKSELEYLVAQGIDLFQGYYFAKPQLEKLLARSEISGWTL